MPSQEYNYQGKTSKKNQSILLLCVSHNTINEKLDLFEGFPKIDGFNSFDASSDADLIQSYQYCTNEALQQPGDLLPPLDPSIHCRA